MGESLRGYNLWAIQLGLRKSYHAQTDVGWARFFVAYFSQQQSVPALRRLWGFAEHQSVHFGVDMADAMRLRPQGEVGDLASLFLFATSNYRTALIENRPLDVPWLGQRLGFKGTTGPADPRRDEAVAYDNAVTLENVFWNVIRYGGILDALISG